MILSARYTASRDNAGFQLVTNAKLHKRHTPRDSIVKYFWRDFDAMLEKDRRGSIQSTLNKVLALMIGSPIHSIVVEKQLDLYRKGRVRRECRKNLGSDVL